MSPIYNFTGVGHCTCTRCCLIHARLMRKGSAARLLYLRFAMSTLASSYRCGSSRGNLGKCHRPRAAITSSTDDRRFPLDRVWPLGSVLLKKYRKYAARPGRSCAVVHHQIGRFYGPFGRLVCGRNHGRNREYGRGTEVGLRAQEPVLCGYHSIARVCVDGQNTRSTHERIRIFRCHCGCC